MSVGTGQNGPLLNLQMQLAGWRGVAYARRLQVKRGRCADRLWVFL